MPRVGLGRRRRRDGSARRRRRIRVVLLLRVLRVLFRGVLERPGRGLLREVRVRLDERAEAGVVLGVGDLPGEAAEDHAHENDGDAPHVRLAGVVALRGEHLGREVRVAADDARRERRLLARVVEHRRGAKVDQLHDVVRGHDAVVELQVAVREAQRVQVLDAVADLAEDAVYLGARHAAGHDDAEEVVRRVLHHLRAHTVSYYPLHHD